MYTDVHNIVAATSMTSDFAYCDRWFRRLSIGHVRTLCSNGRRCRHDFFCIRQPRVSSRSL